MNQGQTPMMENQEMNNGITIKDLYFIITKHIIAILCFLALSIIGGAIYTKIEKPVYTSTGTMLVSYEGTGTSISTDYTFSSYIANTFVVFITQDIVMDAVSAKTGVETNVLKKNTTVKNSSLILSITYTASDASEAQKIAEAIIETAQEVADTLDNENNPVYHLLYDNLKVLSEAKEGARKSHTLRNLAIALAIGVVLAFIYVLLNEIFDNKFKSSEEVERVLGIPLLAGIPEYQFEDEKQNVKVGKDK